MNHSDISNRTDIEQLVDSFYKKVIVDDLIGHFFTEVVELDWNKHIPVMYDFWESTVFGLAKYKGNPMLKHIALDEMKAIEAEHFSRWLVLWEETVNELFSGEKADETIKRARQISGLMQFKVQEHRKRRGAKD